MSDVLILPYIGTVTLRTLWIAVGLWYLTAGSALAMSRHRYPLRVWSTFYMAGLGILLFFNIEYYAVAQRIITFSEIVFLVVLAVGGTTMFITLLIFGDELDQMPTFPRFHEMPVFLVNWALGREAELESDDGE